MTSKTKGSGGSSDIDANGFKRIAVRPTGVGEVIRRIIGKCVTKVTKREAMDASGSLQVCAGQKSGSEAAIHAMREMFEADETDAELLMDASNAFNSLNRAAALHNVRVICPAIAIYLISTYRAPARLFVEERSWNRLRVQRKGSHSR